MNSTELYAQFSRMYDHLHSKPQAPAMANFDRAKVSVTLLLGIFPAAFASVGTFSEFVASRGVTEMSPMLILISAVIGILAFELTLLAVPFLKAWVDTRWHRFALSTTTFIAWAVSAVANTNLILSLLEGVEGSNGYVWTARVAFVLLTGVAGATMAVLMGEVAGGIVMRSRLENSAQEDEYRDRLSSWEGSKEEAWLTSPEFRAVKKLNRNNIREATASNAPKLDWRLLSDSEKDWIAGADVDQIMEEYEMTPEQRKTAINWKRKAEET